MPTSGLDPHESDGWRDCCCAAGRKIGIGERAQVGLGHRGPAVAVLRSR